MTTTYEPAVKAAEIALNLIERHHRHLEQARIVWLKTTTGQSKARVCNALLQHAFGKDSSGEFPAFCVVVTDVDWARHRKSREALVDTLLCSMTRQSNADTGKDRWAISKPDVSMFLGVVQRHGLNTTEELQVGRLIKDLPEQLALAMDGDDQDDDEDESDDGEPAAAGWENAPTAPAVFGSSANGESADPTRDDSWEDATRPDVSPEALSKIRGSVEAAVT
jgi:hypothetical protein